MPELSANLEKFCHEYLVDLSGKEAAIRAGYSPRSARAQASQMLMKPHVKARIEELKVKITKKLEVSQERVLQQIIDDREAALADKQYSVAMKANELLGKYLAMFTENVNNNNTLTLAQYVLQRKQKQEPSIVSDN